ncbi:MAG: aldo/keto reductase [Anaerolineales bacterium]
MNNPLIQIAKDLRIPQMGFGTYGLGRNATQAILHALRSGYRHLDTADIYSSHSNIAEAISQGGIPREEIFITTKLWSHSLSAQRVGPAVDRFLRELNTEYIDLLLIHWPGNTPVAETLGAMDKARQAGRLRSLGVSNFDEELVQKCLDSGVPIVNNQIECNLNHRPSGVLAFCSEHKITVTAYSPLEKGTGRQERVVTELAKKYEVTREEVLLNWLMNKGMIVIPRSADPKHIVANFHVLAWELEAGDTDKIDNA